MRYTSLWATKQKRSLLISGLWGFAEYTGIFPKVVTMIFVEYIHTVSVCICLYPTLEGIYKFWNNDFSFNHIRTKSAVGTQRHSVSKSALRVVCIYGFMGEPFSTFMIFFPRGNTVYWKVSSWDEIGYLTSLPDHFWSLSLWMFVWKKMSNIYISKTNDTTKRLHTQRNKIKLRSG